MWLSWGRSKRVARKLCGRHATPQNWGRLVPVRFQLGYLTGLSYFLVAATCNLSSVSVCRDFSGYKGIECVPERLHQLRCRVVVELPGEAVAIVDPAEWAEAVVVHGRQSLSAVGQRRPQLIELFL